jgi:hypothetical protein
MCPGRGSPGRRSRHAGSVHRATGDGAVAATIIGQYLTSWEFWVANDVDDRLSTTVNSFSFFTFESNILTVVVFAAGEKA